MTSETNRNDKVKEKKTISFIFPVLNGGIGGVQMLFINLIHYLSRQNNRKIRLYDYNQGVIRINLQLRCVTNYDFVSLDSSESEIPNKGDEIIIMANYGLLFYPQLLKVKENTNILVWDVYYPFWNTFNLIKGIPIPFFKHSMMKRLCSKNGVIFMDHNGLDIFQLYGLVFLDTQLVFIPVMDIDYIYNAKKAGETINVAYIGRTTYWKITPVMHFLKTMSESNRKYKLSIITNDSINFKKYLQIPTNVTVEFKERLYGDKLKKLLKTIDIGIGMGTASLEFAKLGIPTILIDFSHQLFPSEYKFRWLFNNKPGNLGNDLTTTSLKELPLGHTWDNIIDSFEKDKINISHKCYNYVELNHSIETTSKSLLKYADISNLAPSDFNNITIKTLLLKRRVAKMLKHHRLLEN